MPNHRPVTRPPAPPARPAAPAEPSIEELERGLRINEHALEVECRNQPDLMYRVTKRLAMAISKRDALKQRLEETESLVGDEMRQLAVRLQQKFTETGIASQLNLDQRVTTARNELLDQKGAVGALEALKEAFVSRGYALRDLIQLHLANYYSGTESLSGNLRNARAAQIMEQRRVNEQQRRPTTSR